MRMYARTRFVARDEILVTANIFGILLSILQNCAHTVRIERALGFFRSFRSRLPPVPSQYVL
jgi:hypothetical protein